jgi:hypothetical protein
MLLGRISFSFIAYRHIRVENDWRSANAFR